MSAPAILVLYAHPAPHLSRVNRRMAEAIRAIPNATLHDLYETYPDFHIDVAQEQEMLSKADLIVLLHPVQWYGMPALLKEWCDTVLEYGWAYGHGGTALRGKDFLLAATAGSPAHTYSEQGRHGYAFSAFLPPYIQIAKLCGMHWQTPFVLFGADQVEKDDIEAHATAFHRLLSAYPARPASPDTSASRIS